MSNISTPETALQRERRLNKELSSRLVNTIINRIFDLRPEKAAQRRSYLFVLFILCGFLISLIYYPLSLWLGHIQTILNSLLGANSTIPVDIAFVNFVNFLLQILYDPRILQYLPVFVAPFFIALQSAAIYLADIFELEDVGVARSFVSGVALTGSDSTIRISHGEVIEDHLESPTYLIGGPGKVVVELDSVALFERADGTSHVIGPTGNQPGGKATLEGFERFRQALDIRNHHVDLRDQDNKSKAVQSRSRDGISIKATDVRLMFSIYRGENREVSESSPYPFSQRAVEQIVYDATSRVTPEQTNPSTFEFSWINNMIGLIRGGLGGFMSQHNLTEYMASIGRPEIEKVKEREGKIVEEKQKLTQSEDDAGNQKEFKLPDFQARHKIKNLFTQFTDEFTSKARNSGVELHWIGVGTWESPIEIVPEKHLEAWKLTQQNLKNDSKAAMDKIEQEEITEKTKELILKVPLDVFDEILDFYKSPKKSGKQAPKKKDSHKFDSMKQEDDDKIFESEEMDQFAEMLHILHDIREEKDEQSEDSEPKDTDHAYDLQALLLGYRKQFQETADFIKDKNEPVPQNILDAIKYIDNQIAHWVS